MSKKIALATGNRHKLEEVRAILAPLGYEVLSSDDFGGLPDVVEDGMTFKENALKKARVCAKAWNCTVLADDTGLEVKALNGEPGVHSARYVAEHDFAANLKAVLKKMEGAADRSARFVTVLALVSPDGVEKTAEGEVRGTMATEPHGEGGFGYDPAFIPEGYDKTFGELPAAVKNNMSHRARALQNAIKAGII